MSLLQTRIQNEGLYIPAFKADLEKTVDADHRKRKYHYYFDLQLSILVENSARIAYEHLFSVGKLERRPETLYACHDSILNRWNPIGKALATCSSISLYVGYHTIEYYVDLFTRKSQSRYYSFYQNNPFHFTDNLPLLELFKKTPYYRSDRSHQREWENQFDKKTWTHFYILEYESFCPGSFMCFVRQWYAPQQYNIEKEIVLGLLREQFVEHLIKQHKYGISFPETLHDETINNNLFQLYQTQKIPLSRQVMFKLSRLESFQYTSREIQRMERTEFTIPPSSHWLTTLDPLSPHFIQEFTLHGLQFQNVHQYICFRVVKFFSQNIAMAYESTRNGHPDRSLVETMKIKQDRTIYHTCQLLRNSVTFHQYLAEGGHENNPNVIELYNSLLSWMDTKDFIHEKIIFLADCFDFIKWKPNETDLKAFIELMYPKLQYSETAPRETGEIYSEIPTTLRSLLCGYMKQDCIQSFAFPLRFTLHFLNWFSCRDASFRSDCLCEEFTNMFIPILKRHRFHKEHHHFDMKQLRKKFSVPECLLIKKMF